MTLALFKTMMSKTRQDYRRRVWRLLAGSGVCLLLGSSLGLAAPAQSLEISVPYYRYDYKEDLTPPLKSTEKGWLYGLRLSYKHQNPESGGFWLKIPGAIRITTAACRTGRRRRGPPATG